MSKYLNNSLTQQFSIIGDAINNDDDVTISELISSIQLENISNENEIYRNSRILGLSDDNPILQFLYAKRSLFDTFVSLLQLYLLYITDNKTNIPKQDYPTWASNYNDFYKTQPLTIFNLIQEPTGIDFSDEAYTIYQDIKTNLNPVRNNNNNGGIGSVEFYHVLGDPFQKTQVKLNRKLPPPTGTNFWFFWKTEEDVVKYFKKYPLEFLDTTWDPPVFRKAFKVVLVRCLVNLEFIDKLPPIEDTDVTTYSVNDIYDYYVTVMDVYDFTLFAPFSSTTRTKRVSRGRP